MLWWRPLFYWKSHGLKITNATEIPCEQRFYTCCLLTYVLFTYFMEESPSGEANKFSASQEIPCILWNLKVHYCIYRCLPPVPILNFASVTILILIMDMMHLMMTETCEY